MNEEMIKEYIKAKGVENMDLDDYFKLTNDLVTELITSSGGISAMEQFDDLNTQGNSKGFNYSYSNFKNSQMLEDNLKRMGL